MNSITYERGIVGPIPPRVVTTDGGGSDLPSGVMGPLRRQVDQSLLTIHIVVGATLRMVAL